jgi:beta-lactamase regulating signal transducer with metallopeptidase domain
MHPTPLALLLVKATIILLAALGITRALGRASAGTRHLVWLVTLGTLLLVPGLAVWAPIRLAVLPPERELAVGSRAVASDLFGTPSPATTGDAISSERVEPVAERNAATPTPASALRSASTQPPRPLTVALLVWAAVALGVGACVGWAWLAARRIVRRGRTLQTRDWLDPLYEVSDRLDLDEPPRLVRSEDVKMPFACGVVRPTIVLPAECDAWTSERRRAVLLHEVAHVRRHDLAGHTLGRLVCALYWFHPLVWTAAKRLRAESERACDDLALLCGARAADYAEHLLDIVTSVRHDRTPLVALAMARPSEFEGRMLAILDPERSRLVPSRRQTALLTAALGLIAVTVGAAAPMPRAASDAEAPEGVAPQSVASTTRRWATGRCRRSRWPIRAAPTPRSRPARAWASTPTTSSPTTSASPQMRSPSCAATA